MNRRTWILITLAVIVVGALLAWRYAVNGGVKQSASQAPVAGSAAKGQTAPEFSAATDKGFFDLAKTRKPVFLEVFATWCPHCQRETAIIDRLYRQYAGRVDFIGVSGSDRAMDGQSPTSEQDVLNFAAVTHAQYPLAYDGSLQIAREYLQGAFPTLVVIAPDKKITYITTGETPYGELDAAIRSALAH
ncbi:MAG TPA: TlpA family protein disulfide reductase [Candidatus Baltobacteraceae bacterium]|jgi:thiol-disulfide isomerase/thioredoxin|nr:TlpA family protein disulfide reductase [Candidatus Baltobacteraceae bacterium]